MQVELSKLLELGVVVEVPSKQPEQERELHVALGDELLVALGDELLVDDDDGVSYVDGFHGLYQGVRL